MTINEVKKLITPTLKKYGVKRAALFGSLARGEIKSDSDVDVLVDIKKDISLLDFIGFKQDLESMLGRKVDLVEYQSIKPVIKEEILKDQVPIL